MQSDNLAFEWCFRAIEHCEVGLAVEQQTAVQALRIARDKARVGLQKQEKREKLALSCPLCVNGGTAGLCLKHKEEVRLRSVCPDCESGGCGELCEKHLFQHPTVCMTKGFTPLQCMENGTSAAAMHAIAYSEHPPHANGLERGKSSNLFQGMQLLVTERDDKNNGTADASFAQYGTVVSVGEKGRVTVWLECDQKEEEFWISGHSRLKPRKKHGILDRLQVYRFVYLMDKWRTSEAELGAGIGR